MDRDNKGQVVIYTGFDGEETDTCIICNHPAGDHYMTYDSAFAGCSLDSQCEGFVPDMGEDDQDAESEEWVTDHPDFPKGTCVRYEFLGENGSEMSMIHYVLATRDGWAKIRMVEDNHIKVIELSDLTVEDGE